MRYERIFIETHHGFDGKTMSLGKSLGNTTEYDQEATICAFIQLHLLDDKHRCEYLPKTKRQWERPCLWARDFHVIIRCSFVLGTSYILGDYEEKIASSFPRMAFRGSGKVPTIVLSKQASLDNPQITAKDLYRSLLFFLD